jgi:hypothetical protein
MHQFNWCYGKLVQSHVVSPGAQQQRRLSQRTMYQSSRVTFFQKKKEKWGKRVTKPQPIRLGRQWRPSDRPPALDLHYGLTRPRWMPALCTASVSPHSPPLSMNTFRNHCSCPRRRPRMQHRPPERHHFLPRRRHAARSPLALEVHSPRRGGRRRRRRSRAGECTERDSFTNNQGHR